MGSISDFLKKLSPKKVSMDKKDGSGSKDPLPTAGKGGEKTSEAGGVEASPKKGIPTKLIVAIATVAVIIGAGWFMFGDMVQNMLFPPPPVAVRVEKPIPIDTPVDEFKELDLQAIVADNTTDNSTDNATDNITEIAIEVLPEVKPTPVAKPAAVVKVTPKPATTPVPKPVATPKAAVTLPVVTPPKAEPKPPTVPELSDSCTSYDYTSSVSRAQYAASKGNDDIALSLYLEAAKCRANTTVDYNIVQLQIKVKKPLDAIITMRRSALSEQDLSVLLIEMADNGYLREASSAVVELLKRDKYGKLYYASGYLKEKSGDIGGASNDYRKGMIRSDYDPYMAFGYARCQDILGYYDEAAIYYKLVVVDTKDQSLKNAANRRLDEIVGKIAK